MQYLNLHADKLFLSQNKQSHPLPNIRSPKRGDLALSEALCLQSPRSLILSPLSRFTEELKWPIEGVATAPWRAPRESHPSFVLSLCLFNCLLKGQNFFCVTCLPPGKLLVQSDWLTTVGGSPFFKPRRWLLEASWLQLGIWYSGLLPASLRFSGPLITNIKLRARNLVCLLSQPCCSLLIAGI